MQKPELKDFGLTEDLLRKHEEQKKAVERKLLKYLQEKKDKRKTFAIFYFLASIIVLIIILATEFSEFSRILLVIYGVGIPWVIVVCLIKTEETIRDISVSERTEIENSIIDRKLERLISDYNYALCRYKETTSINEKSLVKCEQFIRLTPDKLLSMGDVWVVFSNEYLENVASFPNLNMKIKATPEFKEYYHNLLERQKGILPKPKKHLNIAEGELDFYYPCSELFVEMKGKTKGEIVKVRGGDMFKILDVINKQ